MLIEFDPAKDEINRAKHGMSLADAERIDWETAIINVDDRNEYGETRYQALGLIGARVHFVAFTVRAGAVRVISLRKANKREEKRYVNET